MPLNKPAENIVGDPQRQAVASLRGYAYQLYATTLAWIGLRSDEDLYLEVAEDYAIASQQALEAIQVKDTAHSGKITLRSAAVVEAIDGFVYLVLRNRSRAVNLRFLTTSEIGRERANDDRPAGESGLAYWRRAASHAEVAPLREVLLRLPLGNEAKQFITERNDHELRADLLRRIHWDCGSPGVSAIREELVEAVLSASDRAGPRLTVQEARHAAGNLVELALATVTSSGERRLTHLQLRSVLETSGQLAVGRRDLEALVRGADRTALAVSEIVRPANEIDIPLTIAPRGPLVDSMIARLKGQGVVFVCGATGMGKTLLARLTARRLEGDWGFADFGGLDAAQTADRLTKLSGEIAIGFSAGVILDDLNTAESPLVAPRLTQLRAALARQDKLCIVTSYRAPSVRLNTDLGLTAGAVEHATDLSVVEISDLVRLAGGGPAEWAGPLFLATGGHPQLTHATITHLIWREWPPDELERLRALDTTGLDLAEQKAAARRRLMDVAPEPARALLYRMSLLIGSFRRDLALSLSCIVPQIPSPGEHLDALTGPWIDLVSQGRLRVSPLLSDAGVNALTQEEQLLVHRAAAESLVLGPSLDVQDAASGMGHALLARAEAPLMRLAAAVITSDLDTREQLASWLATLRMLPTDRAIFPENHAVSRHLRLAQLLLALASETEARTSKVWAALLREIAFVDDLIERERLETTILTKVLITQRATQLPNWVSHAARLDALFAKYPDMAPSGTLYEAELGRPLAFYLINLALGLKTVSGLAEMFQQIQQLEPAHRESILAALRSREDDLSHVINHPWITEFGPNEERASLPQVALYQVMAAQASGWGERRLAILCHMARAILLDEYADDEEQALSCLEEAEAEHGADPAIWRAKAKVAFRRRRFEDARKLIRDVEGSSLRQDAVERTFMFREAAMSAAELGDHHDALVWFKKALASVQLTGADAFRALTIGLEADVALAEFRCDERQLAIARLWRCLSAAEKLDATESLKATYLHKILGHACLWASGQVTKEDFDRIGMPCIAPPGMCSNPNPMEQIRDLPRASIEGSRYLLAIADIALGGHLQLDTALDEILAGRYIVVLEIQRRLARLEHAMLHFDLDALPLRLAHGYDAVWLGMRRMEADPDPTPSPGTEGLPLVEGAFPKAPAEVRSSGNCELFLNDAFFALYLLGDLSEPVRGPADFQPVLEGLAKLGYANPTFAREGSDSRQAIFWDIWHKYRADPVVADSLLLTGLRMMEWASGSMFGRLLLGPLGKWAQKDWAHVISEQRFRLRAPSITAPLIQQAIEGKARDSDRLALILRAAVPAFNINLNASFLQLLAASGD